MSKEERCKQVLKDLVYLGYEVKQYPNYQLQVKGVNLWVGTGKWFDPATSHGGDSVHSFLNYLESLSGPRVPEPEPKTLALTDFEVALIKFIRSYPGSPVSEEFEGPTSPPWDL